MLLSSFNLPVNISKHGKRYVAYSPALDISTAGKSTRDARKKFGELVNIFFEELSEEGTTEEVLRELGWQKVQNKLRPPIVSQENIEIKIPALA